jgi:hypothetical protein
MEKPASSGELGGLHALVAKSFKQRLEDDIKDNIPTDAATLGALIKFLKDNNITADPADADDLGELRDKLSERNKVRAQRRGNVLALVQADSGD